MAVRQMREVPVQVRRTSVIGIFFKIVCKCCSSEDSDRPVSLWVVKNLDFPETQSKRRQSSRSFKSLSLTSKTSEKTSSEYFLHRVPLKETTGNVID